MTKNIQEDMEIITREVLRYCADKFTGKVSIELHMNQGGIGQINILLNKSLKQPKN